jgi:hypothetical protein
VSVDPDGATGRLLEGHEDAVAGHARADEDDLIEHDIAVTTNELIKIRRLDTGYFDEE